MNVTFKLTNRVMYVGLAGELDESSASNVRTQLDAIIEKGQFDKMVIEMSAMAFMDSTGIGVLIGRFKKLKAKGISIFLASPMPNVDKVLTLSGIYDIMPKINY